MATESESSSRSQDGPEPSSGSGTPGAVPPPPWAREQGGRRAGRADRPTLSREAIVDAALRIVDEEGFDAVSMRRVAQEFGTGAASLYAYVANKDELLDLLADHVMGEARLSGIEPEADVDDWIEQVKAAMREYYRIISSHRDLAKVFLGRIPFGPNGLRTVEDMLRLLRAHGLPDYIAAYMGDLFSQYLVGTAIEASMWRERYPEATDESVVAAMAEVSDYLAALPKERFPNTVELARLMTGPPEPDSPLADRFELGLDILMRGITTFLPARQRDENA
ncbi:TetR/AcrR family transcriptional regulator C-terminal domain-containing protein [Actinospica durhamensis]|uniref:TetR/AcrR family transcriptional regulator C-terminal domain-containing protein n=1 Tax=Actinospica durhamensis TaxID=1508375 RepID=A0A941IRD9_9ACTN|nr:TetR/AcrR family transcriptional regulator [Actinospica durhamensis]MBR7832196.1 TetR/AcrR family transcriptional regulator C-terminal domain-containing protein [Actinospica durhamensis]